MLFGNNPKFRKKALPMLIITTFLFFFYCGLYNDQLNVLTPYFTAKGWSANAVTLPFTIGSYVVIVLYPIFSDWMLKRGIKKILIPCMVIVAITVALTGVVSNDPILYLIDLTIFRCIVMAMQLSAMLLCSNWFIYGRGRALGVVTAGAPLATAILIRALTYGVNTYGMTPTYVVVGACILVITVLIAIIVKDSPEECGLFPDGLDEMPVSQQEDEKMTLKEVFQNKLAWPVIISYGLLGFGIVGVMAFYVTRLDMSGTDPGLYLTWLSIAALMGIPLSYLLGIIDDKIGTWQASLVLCAVGYVLPLLCLLFMPANNIAMIVLCAIGIAAMTGGEPTLQPSMIAYVYGRKKFNAANRWIISLQAIIMAFALPVISTIFDKTGKLDGAYILLLVFTAIAAVCFIIIGRHPDHDRAEENKVEAK